MESTEDFKKRIKRNHKFVSFMMKLYNCRPIDVYRALWCKDEN